MYVKNHMLPKEKLTTLSLNESIDSALKKIEKGDFLSLPVLDGEKFKGIFMKEAVYRYFFEVKTDDKEIFLVDTKDPKNLIDKMSKAGFKIGDITK